MEEKTVNQLMGEITSLAVLITRNTENDVFIRYSGHVNQFEIDIHMGGWKSGKDPTINEEMSLDEDDYINGEEEIINNLDEVKNVLVKIAMDEKIDFSELPYEIEEVKHYKIVNGYL